MILRINKNNLYGIVAFILVLLWSGSPYQTIFPIVEELQIAAGMCAIWIIINNIKVKKSYTIYSIAIVVYTVMVLITWITHPSDSVSGYIHFLCFVYIAYAFTQIYSFKSVVDIFNKFMTYVAIISIICFSLLNNTALLDGLPRFENVNGVQYGIGIFFNYIVEYPNRNCGVFWEPGIYASFLAIAIIFELCFKEEVCKLRVLLYFVTLLTANSSAGFVLFVLCLLLVFTPQMRSHSSKFVNVFSYFLLMAVLIIFTNIEQIITSIPALLNNEYVIKLLPETVMDSARYLGLVHNMNIFAENPLFGAGIGYVYRNIAYVADISTCTFLMSIYGVLGFLFTFCWILGVLSQKHLNLHTRIVILAIFMIILNKETHIMIIFTWITMFYLIREGSLNNVKFKFRRR